jgi:hypothetical protein
MIPLDKRPIRTAKRWPALTPNQVMSPQHELPMTLRLPFPGGPTASQKSIRLRGWSDTFHFVCTAAR